MASQELVEMDCREYLDRLIENRKKLRLIFADPPDNLGLAYGTYKDKMPDEAYYNWLELLILKSIQCAEIVWFSYYWAHDLELTHRIRNVLKFRHPSWRAKKILW